jgi:DNA-binding NarL/FixJ family response regulator
MVRGGSAEAGGSGSASSRAGPPPETARDPDASGGRRWKIVIAARPALFCESLSVALFRHPDIEVVGCATDEDQARALIRGKSPAVLVLDYEGFGPVAERTIPLLRRASRGTRILVLATRSSDETVEHVIGAGASGLVGKQQSLETLVHAIQAVAAGELWANRRATAHVVEILSQPAGGIDSGQERLTAREWEIAEAVGQGLRNKEIARRLKISEKTVKSHLNNVFRKLQVDNRFAVGLYSLDQLQPKT